MKDRNSRREIEDKKTDTNSWMCHTMHRGAVSGVKIDGQKHRLRICSGASTRLTFSALSWFSFCFFLSCFKEVGNKNDARRRFCTSSREDRQEAEIDGLQINERFGCG